MILQRTFPNCLRWSRSFLVHERSAAQNHIAKFSSAALRSPFRNASADLTTGCASPLVSFQRHSMPNAAAMPSSSSPLRTTIRHFAVFQNESHFHTVADQTLEDIQDAVENTLEDAGIPDFEVTYASGVMTLVFAPHGTWVINKQTPNEQLWWSSPISGPRRYEYDHDTKDWIFTRDETHSSTLGQELCKEIKAIYQVDIEL